MSVSDAHARDGRSLGERMLGGFALLIALAAAVNAYSYSFTAAIPLIQSDVWYFLDGFLGRFLEYGFHVSDLFRQANPADTNLPLQKLFLFFHTRYFGMDFRLEGLLATAAAIAGVFFYTSVAAGRPWRLWRGAEFTLAAVLALLYLSLNSTNIYTWPLAGMWFLPILIAAVYLAYAAQPSPGVAGVFAASAAVGLALDEVAYPVFIAAIGAALLTIRRREAGSAARLLAGVAGIAVARLVYWWFNRDVIAATATASRSFAPLFSPEVWKAASIPLTESLIAQQNLPELFGSSAPTVATAVWLLLALAHVGFWWVVLRTRPERGSTDVRLTRFAVAMMLLFYGLVVGIVIQRVPTFGFEYLHQPRYVLFYQVHLVALALMAYNLAVGRAPFRAGARVAFIALLIALGALQWQLSTLAWKHVKYVSAYTQGVAQSIGQLQADPASKIKCADIMTVCDFAPAKRAELLDRLMRYRMNIFSTDFQNFHRLYPFPPAVAETPPAKPATPPVSAAGAAITRP